MWITRVLRERRAGSQLRHGPVSLRTARTRTAESAAHVARWAIKQGVLSLVLTVLGLICFAVAAFHGLISLNINVEFVAAGLFFWHLADLVG